jgi:hypothetical protein
VKGALSNPRSLSMMSSVLRNFTRSYVHQAILACLVGLVLLSTSHALAAQVGVITPDPSPAVSSGVLAWASVTALLCTFVMGVTSQGTPTPWNLSPVARVWIALGVSAVSGFAHSLQSGVTVQTATLTAASSLLMAVIAHFSTPSAMQNKEDPK